MIEELKFRTLGMGLQDLQELEEFSDYMRSSHAERLASLAIDLNTWAPGALGNT